MRNIKRWLAFALCALMLCTSFGVNAAAVESEAPLALDIHSADEAGMVQVDILATEGQTVADGKLVVTYDPEVLVFDAEGIEVGSAWTDAEDVTLSHSLKDRKVILAFACADAANEGVLFSIRFYGSACGTDIILDGSASYITGTGSVPALGGTYCPSAQFVDTRDAIPMIHEAVDFMVDRGYMNGMDATHFGPNLELNRAMMVTILYRIAGEPDVSGTHNFVDVPAGEFYTEPVIWALENGITNGLDATHFAPGKSLTRQELVTFLHRFAKHMDYDVTKTTDLSGYTDANKVQPYAVEAFQWAVASGVVNGTSETTLSPESTTTRAQICIMVSRLLKAQN